MKIQLVIISLFFSLISAAQTATISGILTDKDLKNEPLPFANISIKGTTLGTTTDMDGKYAIDVPAGNHVIVFSFLGYQSKEVSFAINPGEKKIINQSIGSGSVTMKDVVVKATVKGRESESALLLEQKKAVDFKQSIGAQELSKKGVGDAASAVAKVSGVSKQEGVKNVFVRGLGDRYNSTSLNGLPLPSEDPEFKNISLKFFTTDIIKNININKTFSGDLYGDVAGANIDISSKELEKSKILTISVGSGFNTNAIGTQFITPEGQNYFGTLENGDKMPLTDLRLYSFNNGFKPINKDNAVNNDFSIVAGKKFNFGDNKSLSLFGVAVNNSQYTFKEGQSNQVNSAGNFSQQMTFKKYEYNASQSFLGNIKFKFGDNRSIAFNSLYIKDNNQSIGDYLGFNKSINDNMEEDKSFIRRQQVNNNVIFSNQMLFNYNITPKFDFNLSAGYSRTRGSEPDRKTNSYDFAGGAYKIANNSSGLNNRFFSILKETDIVGKAEISYKLNPDDALVKKITIGGNFRKTNRSFNFTQLNFNFFGIPNIDINNPDTVFNQQSIDNGVFDIRTGRGTNADAFQPFYYKGNRKILAGYVLLNYPVTEKLTILGSARAENINQKVEWDTNLSSSVTDLTRPPSIIKKTYFLPSLVIKYDLNEKNSIRLAGSQTYTLPQFKEVAPFLYEDVNFSSFGNPDLIPATNLNFDLKYDWYLSGKEIISLGAFYKKITNAINRVRVSSAANELSYVNTPNTTVLGVEFEARKVILNNQSDSKESNLSIGLNVSYLFSDQELKDVDSDKLTVLFTNSRDMLEGASPLLINSDISYNFSNAKNSLTSTLVFNYFLERISAIGTSENQNLSEQVVPTLDFINKFDLVKNKFGISFSLKNLLNPSLKITQQTTDNNTTQNSQVSEFKKGVFGSFGIYWNL